VNWPLFPLAKLVTIRGGGTPSKKVSEYWNGDIPWVSVKDFKSRYISDSRDKITRVGVENSATNIIPAGNIIIPTRMALGKVGITAADIAINQDLKALLIKEPNKVDLNYLARFLESKAEDIIRQGKGATVKGITLAVLKSIDVPLPPLPMQKQIAESLEKADILRGQCLQMEQELNTLAPAVFLELFGDPVTNPKGWKTSSLEEQLEFLTSGSRGWAKHYDDKGVDTFIRIQNVLKDKMNLNDIQTITAPISQEAKRTKVQEGDVLLSITADLGRAGVVRNIKSNFYISQHLALIRVKQDVIIPEFLSALLVSPAGLNQFEQKNKGGTKAGLNFTDIRTLKISIPPIELQEKFKMIKMEIDKQLIDIKAVIIAYNDNFNSLMQCAFKGELTIKEIKDVA
jgi:type I restriction enzyme S subunit